METILIRLLPATYDPHADTSEADAEVAESPGAAWQVIGANRHPVGEPAYGSLNDAASAAHYRRCVVLAPSENILLTTVNLKARNREQLVRAMPFALEEELAENVEQMHFAPGPRQVDGSYPVAVVARTDMDLWLAQLRRAGLIPQVLIPDVLAVPLHGEQRWSLLIEPDRALLRTGAFSGFTLEPDNLEVMLSCMLEEAATPPVAIDVYGIDGEADAAPLPRLPTVTYELRASTPSPGWAAGIDEKRTINVMQGQYRVKSDVVRLFKPWRAAAALAGVWVALQAVNTTLDYRRLAKQDVSLQVDIAQVYRETFPGTTRIVNARVQMEQELQALRQASETDTQAGFMPLLNAGGRALTDAADVSIVNLDYLDEALNVSLSARELQSLEAIKQNIEEQGLAARIESAETRGNAVNGRLVIRERRG
ncbi:MAG: type II secretion system protein GspL [Gammaproteobacteria bacterium]